MGIGLLRPSTIHQVIMEVMKVVDIGLKRPVTLPQVIVEVVDVGKVLPNTLLLLISQDMMIEVDIGHNRPFTLSVIYICSDLYFQQLT